jgi:hypothetical protein
MTALSSTHVALIFVGDIATDSRIAAAICWQLATLSVLRSDLGAGLFVQPLLSKSVEPSMAAPIVEGTDVWVAVPASPPLRLTIRACLDDHCRGCGLPVYRCESEGGQMMSLCASHLRLRN